MWDYKKLKEVTLEKYLDLLNPERQYHIKRGLAALKSVEKKPKKKFEFDPSFQLLLSAMNVQKQI